MNWDFFVYFAAFALIHWAFGAWAAWKGKRRAAIGIPGVGAAIELEVLHIGSDVGGLGTSL